MNRVAANFVSTTECLYGVSLEKIISAGVKVYTARKLRFLNSKIKTLEVIYRPHRDSHYWHEHNQIWNCLWEQSFSVIIVNNAIATAKLVKQSKQHSVDDNLDTVK